MRTKLVVGLGGRSRGKLYSGGDTSPPGREYGKGSALEKEEGMQELLTLLSHLKDQLLV